MDRAASAHPAADTNAEDSQEQRRAALRLRLFARDVKTSCLRQRAVLTTIMEITQRKGGVLVLNENIKAIRKAKGLSQQELAVKLNVVRQTVSKWEVGVSHT